MREMPVAVAVGTPMPNGSPRWWARAAGWSFDVVGTMRQSPGEPRTVARSSRHRRLPANQVGEPATSRAASARSARSRADRSAFSKPSTYCASSARASGEVGSSTSSAEGATSARRARARCSALFTAATDVPGMSATSAAGTSSTSRGISTARRPSAVRHAFVAIRCSHTRTEARPSNAPYDRHARR
ncbi:hypothetical protein [Saccharothrix syringae]|uniref:hypothetical protein n=1 Tax=Saccharothrix syringae TaxID=103733 RepID=UPI001D1762FD|nr:hypothetical protein [Saccharothrix syringae]